MGTGQARGIQVQNIFQSFSRSLVHVQNKQVSSTLETPTMAEVLLRGARAGITCRFVGNDVGGKAFMLVVIKGVIE